MSKRQVLMLIGVIVVIVPFLGFPSSWQRFFEIVCGILVIGIAYSMAPKIKPVDSADLPFSEHKSDNLTNPNPTDQK
jgi:hypothetical protein